MSVTFPPFEPLVPQLSEVARRKYPDVSLFVIATSVKVIDVVVFVTWKISPRVFVRLPLVMVKELVPFEASPDID